MSCIIFQRIGMEIRMNKFLVARLTQASTFNFAIHCTVLNVRTTFLQTDRWKRTGSLLSPLFKGFRGEFSEERCSQYGPHGSRKGHGQRGSNTHASASSSLTASPPQFTRNSCPSGISYFKSTKYPIK